MPLSYEQRLAWQVANPGAVCGPDVEPDDRRWWQHLPGLNPYAELERQARAAGRQAEAEAG